MNSCLGLHLIRLSLLSALSYSCLLFFFFFGRRARPYYLVSGQPGETCGEERLRDLRPRRRRTSDFHHGPACHAVLDMILDTAALFLSSSVNTGFLVSISY